MQRQSSKKTEFSDALSRLFRKPSKPDKPDKPDKPNNHSHDDKPPVPPPRPPPRPPPSPPSPTPTPQPSTLSFIISDEDVPVLKDIDPQVLASARAVIRNVPIFDGALYDGQMCQGGKGGSILTVNRLDDSNQRGTLRWALTQSGPRIIKFAVQGLIDLKSNLIVHSGRLTMDASDKMIVITGAGITVQGVHDVFIKNVRFRPGSHYALQSGKTYDALTIMESLYVYIDHVSGSWSTDECISVNKSGFVTVRHSIIAAPLADRALHVENGVPIEHNYGSLITGHRIVVADCLWAFYSIRGPQTDIDNGTTKMFIRNVSFCYFGSGARVEIDENSVGCVAFIENVYRQPESSTMQRKPDLEFVNVPESATSIRAKQIVWLQPKRDSRPDPFADPKFSGTNSNGTISSSRIAAIKSMRMLIDKDSIPTEVTSALSSLPSKNADEIMEDVLTNCGATLPERDPVDKMIIDAVRTKKEMKVMRESDMGGFGVYSFHLRRPV